jgi:hypothetical protein
MAPAMSIPNILRPLIARSPHAATAGTATRADRRMKLDGAGGGVAWRPEAEVRLPVLDARPDTEAVLHLQLHEALVGPVLDARRGLAGTREMEDQEPGIQIEFVHVRRGRDGL